MGLVDILAELHAEEKNPNEDTAQEIIYRLEEKGNFIPSSDRVRREYAYILLREYGKYVKDRTDRTR